jgi:hypothetical protein
LTFADIIEAICLIVNQQEPVISPNLPLSRQQATVHDIGVNINVVIHHSYLFQTFSSLDLQLQPDCNNAAETHNNGVRYDPRYYPTEALCS